MKSQHCTSIYKIHVSVVTTTKNLMAVSYLLSVSEGSLSMLDEGREMSIVHCWLQVLLLYLEWSREYLPV